MDAAKLAAALERDLLSGSARKPQQATQCFGCGRHYIKGDGRFCHPRCRAAFDGGMPPFEPLNLDKFYSLPKGPIGFYVECANCHKRFSSVGWRCCSPECSRAHRLKQELDVELADDPFRTMKRKCQECGGDIPNWRRGRRVSRATKYCCGRCRERYRKKPGMAPDSPQAVLPRETAKKCPENAPSKRSEKRPIPLADDPGER